MVVAEAAHDQHAAEDLACRNFRDRRHQDRRHPGNDQCSAEQHQPQPVVAEDFRRMVPFFSAGIVGAQVRSPS